MGAPAPQEAWSVSVEKMKHVPKELPWEDGDGENGWQLWPPRFGPQGPCHLRGGSRRGRSVECPAGHSFP